MTAIAYDPPRRANVRCRHCSGEIEAYGRWLHVIEIAGLVDYQYRHVATGKVECEPVPPGRAEPYDHWYANRLLSRTGPEIVESNERITASPRTDL